MNTIKEARVFLSEFISLNLIISEIKKIYQDHDRVIIIAFDVMTKSGNRKLINADSIMDAIFDLLNNEFSEDRMITDFDVLAGENYSHEVIEQYNELMDDESKDISSYIVKDSKFINIENIKKE